MPTALIVMTSAYRGPARRESAKRGTCFAFAHKVAALKDKVQNALDETRMLILGAQVLLGFQFQAALQPAFERLPAFAQYLTVAGLGLMIVAVGLLISPGAF